MSGLDAPGFRIEIVGAVTDILHRPDGYAVIGDGNHAARACNQPAAWLFYEAVVMIACVEEVVGLGIDIPFRLLIGEAGMGL